MGQIDRLAAHEKYCAATNQKTAFVVLLSTALIAVVSWRSLDHPFQAWDVVGLLVLGYGIFFLANMAITYRCIRERILLGIVILQEFKILVMSLFPEWFQGTHPFVNQIFFSLHLLSFLIALSLFISAVTHRVAINAH